MKLLRSGPPTVHVTYVIEKPLSGFPTVGYVWINCLECLLFRKEYKISYKITFQALRMPALPVPDGGLCFSI